MEYDEATLAKIVDLGKLGYPAEKCSNILGYKGAEKAGFLADFEDDKSQVFENYQNGKDLADFEMDTKVYQLAKAGDLAAIKEFELRRTRFGVKKDGDIWS